LVAGAVAAFLVAIVLAVLMPARFEYGLLSVGLGAVGVQGRYIVLVLHHEFGLHAVERIDSALHGEMMPYGMFSPRLFWFLWGGGQDWPGEEVAEVRSFVRQLIRCTMACHACLMVAFLLVPVLGSLRS
jgi:hypothetical protein